MRSRQLFVLFFALAAGLTNLAAQSPGSTPDITNPTGNAGALKPQIQTGGSYDAHSGNGTRIVNDLHVPGALGAYGLEFTRYWNSTHNDYEDSEMEWPADFGRSGWSHSWHWAASYEFKYPDEIPSSDFDTNKYTTAINITFPDGHTTQYKIVRLGHGQWMVPASYPQFGPPFTQSEMEVFSYGGMGVHDHLCNMAADGSEFWLCRADGGSVHFVWDSTYGFLAREVYDPHGFRTDLSYTIGFLTHVEQEGGRYLNITWENFPGAGYMITRVQSGTGQSGAGVNQTVSYYYSQVPGPGSFALQQVIYENEALPGGAPGQKVTAGYTYGNCWGDNQEPCSGSNAAPDPLLKRADDPHYAGAMTTIRYLYRGIGCDPPLIYPERSPEYVQGQPYAILAEKSDTGIAVSTFQLNCYGGLRREDDGLGGWRMFYFGRSAETTESGTTFSFGCRGYQLGKLTDFTREGGLPANLPSEKQNFSFGDPRHIWDGRGIMTEAIANGQDDSGEPAEVHHVDGSVHYYDRVNPGASEPLDATRMHNDYNHWLFSQTDERNQTTTFTRDYRRRVKRIDYPDGSYETFGYDNGAHDGFNQVTSHRLPSGAIIIRTYDSRGLLLSEYNSIDDYGARKEYTYYLPGEPGGTPDLVKTVSDGRSRSAGKDFSTRMTYNGRHQILTVEYAGMNNAPDNPIGHYGYDPYGNCISITDELGHPSAYTYDSYRRCTSYIEPLNAPDWNGGPNVASRRWDWLYDRYIQGVGPRDASAHTSNEWHIQIEPAFNSAGERRMTARWHDVNNRIVLEATGYIQAGNLPIGNWYSGPDTETHYFSYNENGQKSSYTDPLSRLTTYDYDLRNRLWKTNETVNTIPRTTETLYDFAGNKTRVNFPVEAAGQRFQQWLDYDAFGQPGRFIDERGNTTNMDYWPWGPMKKLADVVTHRHRDDGGTEDQQTVFYYDGIGRPRQVLFPDASTEEGTYEFGQLKTWKTRKGQIKRLHYDARGREDYHTWDAEAAPRIDRVWDAASRLSRIANSVSTIGYTYDDAAQVRTERDTINGANGTAQLTYYRYPDGAMAHVGYPGGAWVRHDYTARGQLQTVYDNTGGYWKVAVSYSYRLDGKVDYQDSWPGIHTAWSYDGRGFISSITHTRAGQELAKRTYTRDERDRITSFQKGNNPSVNPMEDGRGDHYWYDAEGQLTDAYYGALDPVNNPHGQARQEHFEYDELGNRQRNPSTGVDNLVATKGWITFTRKNNGLNEYRSWSPSIINYDDDMTGTAGNGVMMQEGSFSADYNALNQPRWFWSGNVAGGFVSLGYDPLGRCVKRWNGGASDPATNPAIYFYYDGWNLVQEGPGAASTSRLYIHGARVDEVVASWNAATDVKAYHYYDASGHCTLLTHWNGTILEQYYYDAFGYPYFYDGSGNWLGYSAHGNRFLFTGREWLSDLRLFDFRARMYQPELGRFLQPDPKHFAAGDYNLYRYCHNDPVNKTDPDGLVDLSYTPSSDTAHVWENSFNPSDRFTVAGHANSQFIADQNGNKLTPMQVAKDMIAKGYTPDKPALLVACETGKGEGSFASKLANSLAKLTGKEAKVQAPTTKIGSGSAKGAEPTVQNNEKTGKAGELKTFTGTPPEKKLKKNE